MARASSSSARGVRRYSAFQAGQAVPEGQRMLPCGTAFVVKTADYLGEDLLMVSLRQTDDFLIQGGAPAEVPALVEGVPPAAFEPELEPEPAPAPLPLAMVCAMGFSEASASAALAACGGNAAQAVESLLLGAPEPQPQPAAAPGAVGSLAALAAATGQSESVLLALSAEDLVELMKEVGVGVLARGAIAKEVELLVPYAAAVAAVTAAAGDAGAARTACKQLVGMTRGLDNHASQYAHMYPNPAKVALAAEAGGIEAVLGTLRAHPAAGDVQQHAGFHTLFGFAEERGRCAAIRGGGGVALLLGGMRALPQHATH